MRLLLALVALGGLGACAGTFETDYGVPLQAETTRNWNVVGISVDVPESLEISESDTFAPRADIVWHGDEVGDRREQIAAIVEEGVERGASGLNGSVPVTIGVRIVRFHGVTPRSINAAPGAVHNIQMNAQVWSADGTTPLTQPELIIADLEALVGSAAIAAAEEGQTQKVRVTDHIARVYAGWLGTGPDVRRSFFSWGR
ncbi:MAG: DUF6778 family protein [Pseudomonadota bacterium]